MNINSFLKIRGIEHLFIEEKIINGIRCAQFPIHMWAHSSMPVGWYYRAFEIKFHHKLFIDEVCHFGHYYSYSPDEIVNLYGKRIVVVEGPIDAERLRGVGIPAIAIMTAVCPRALIRDVYLMSQSVLLIPDNDEAGRNKADVNMAKFINKGISVNLMWLPCKDIGDIPADEFDLIAGEIRCRL